MTSIPATNPSTHNDASTIMTTAPPAVPLTIHLYKLLALRPIHSRHSQALAVILKRYQFPVPLHRFLAHTWQLTARCQSRYDPMEEKAV